MKKPKYADLADLSEDQRIQLIGHQAMDHKQTVSFIVDDWPDKPERYIRKLQQHFPRIVVIYKGQGPVPNTILVKVGPPDEAPRVN